MAYFFLDTVTAQAYRYVVEHFLLPDLEAANLRNDLWFLRDGAPAHTALETRQFLVEAFGAEKIIDLFVDAP